MKKYLSLLLAALMLLAFLVSCSPSQDGNDVNSSGSSVTQDSTNQSDATTDSTTIDNSQTPNVCEHMWVQNDADQCEHLETCALCGEKRGEDVLHIYFDVDGNCFDKCLNCGKQNDQYTPTKKTLSELRNEKVTIDLDCPDMDMLENVLDTSSWRHAGYVGYNENGNEYIIYAPNDYYYYVTVLCNGNTIEAFNLINQLSILASFDLMELSNGIGIEFPIFDEYNKIQEELLNGLSVLDTVENIYVSYIIPYGFSEYSKNDVYTAGFVPINYKNRLITSYEQFNELFDLTDEKNTSIKAITRETFENNYVLFMSSFYCGSEASSIVLKDLKLVDKGLYLTKYEYFEGEHSQTTDETYALIVISKTEFNQIPPDDFNVYFVDIEITIIEEPQ
ncbi:MAG: hypothetical protein IJ039_05495 [Clostridia bacterium]|nr:hypothetical protein [Clostridia bacterium]